MADSILQELHPVFYPRSIAVVGVSREEGKAGNRMLASLVQAGFKGHLYAIGTEGGEVLGVKVYSRLTDVPGPVDHVMVAVPARVVPLILKDCAAKGVKVVQFFTAGYRELAPEEGLRMEAELIALARAGGFRLLGPNCVGSSCAEVRKPWGPSPVKGEGGPIAFISQGGSVAIWFQLEAQARGLGVGKGVHYGNGCDLNILDFLSYFAADPEVKLIGCYVEGMREGRRLLHLLKGIAPTKPVIFWKGGESEAGARAAASHTGSLRASPVVWEAALRQAGAVPVTGLEEMVDVLVAFQNLGRFEGRRAALVCGLADGGGGESVAAGDACLRGGLEVAPLSRETRARLKDILGEVGSILGNPVDMSQRQGDPASLKRACTVLLADTAIDIVIAEINVDLVLAILGKDHLARLTETLLELKAGHSKPLAIVLPPASASSERAETLKAFASKGTPVFPAPERAALALSRMSSYFRRNA